MREIASELREWIAEGRRFAVASVVATGGSAPRPVGAALAVSAEGTVVGSVSGGCVEGAVYELCLQAIEELKPARQAFGYSDDEAYAVGLTCGGTIEVLVWPYIPARPGSPAAEELSTLDDHLRSLLSGEPTTLVRTLDGTPRTMAVWPDRARGKLWDPRPESLLEAFAGSGRVLASPGMLAGPSGELLMRGVPAAAQAGLEAPGDSRYALTPDASGQASPGVGNEAPVQEVPAGAGGGPVSAGSGNEATVREMSGGAGDSPTPDASGEASPGVGSDALVQEVPAGAGGSLGPHASGEAPTGWGVSGGVGGASVSVGSGGWEVGGASVAVGDEVVVREVRGMLGAGVREICRDGARVEVFVEAHVPPPRMIVFGAIDFAAALTGIGRFLGYHVTVCDARPVFATRRRFPDAHEVVVDWPHRYLARTEVDPRTVIAVLTHDPKFDVPVLEVALRLDVAYVGAMGSRRTHDDRLHRLREAGLTDRELARLRSPIGLDLGARTPEETALSIAAEFIALQRGGSTQPLTTTTGPIHHAA